MNSANLTLAELQGLSATAGGRVKRIYHMDRNVLKAAGISSAVLWRLDRKKLITDGPKSGYHAYTQVLTPAGSAALTESAPVDKCPQCGINRNSPFPCEHGPSN